jgi:hypothetical protein
MKTLLGFLMMASASVGPIAAGEKFVCNMSTLTSAERAHHRELSQSLFAAVEEKRELPDGYGFRLPPSELMTLAEWVSFERTCCPFLTLAIEQTRDRGPLWLRITGSEGAKPFIAAEFESVP